MKKYSINPTARVPFNNNAAVCVGTGRMNLALREEYQKQLEMVQKEIGFAYIRGHGLFCDDMAVYHTYTENGELKEEYNFTYIDMVFDKYLSLGLKPFVELGFMPGQMASGEQTVFYWKGNVTPPADYEKWARLVTNTIEHWVLRYGIDEVVSWPFEVWNEPNLPVFWQGANMDEYFKLYEVTAKAVKRCDARIRVGGPAICGVNDELWMKSFLEHCKANALPLDFVTRHAYGTEMPVIEGHYVYQELRPPEEFMNEPLNSRKIMDSFAEYQGMELHITEFNTSYNPRNPIHDTNLNAAYIASVLSKLGESCASYSYWTFGDVFEELGVAFTPFSGCFGLVANGMIKKPTYWTYVFYKALFENAIAKEDCFIVTSDKNGIIRGVLWNLCMEKQDSLPINLCITADKGVYFLKTETVDEQTCNPLRVWVQMGEPPYPSEEQIELLRRTAEPQINTKQINSQSEGIDLNFDLTPNAVVFFELKKITPQTDRGFIKQRIQGAI